MKKQKIEKWLLLEQTGELSPRRIRCLAREMETSEEARRLKQELYALSGAIRPQEVELPPWTVTKIINRLRRAPVQEMSFSRVWKPVLATAACLVLVSTIFNFHGAKVSSTSVVAVSVAGVDVWHDPIEEDLSRLEGLIVAISDASLNIMEM
jgi:hypothetical protein